MKCKAIESKDFIMISLLCVIAAKLYDGWFNIAILIVGGVAILGALFIE